MVEPVLTTLFRISSVLRSHHGANTRSKEKLYPSGREVISLRDEIMILEVVEIEAYRE